VIQIPYIHIVDSMHTITSWVCVCVCVYVFVCVFVCVCVCVCVCVWAHGIVLAHIAVGRSVDDWQAN